MTRLLVALGCAVGLFSACTDPPSTPTAEKRATAESTLEDDGNEGWGELPPPVDPQSFADATPDHPPELPQLVGLTQAEARRWAQSSGFKVVHQDDAHEGAFVPTIRIVIETDEKGIVTSATAG